MFLVVVSLIRSPISSYWDMVCWLYNLMRSQQSWINGCKLKLAFDGCLSLGSQNMIVDSDIFMHRIVFFDNLDSYFHLTLKLWQILVLIDYTCLKSLKFSFHNRIKRLFLHRGKMLLAVLNTFFVLIFITPLFSKLFSKVLNLNRYLMNFLLSSLKFQLILLNLQQLQFSLLLELG